MFDGLILDVDGTIWDTTSIVAGAWNIAIKNNFPNVKCVNAEILKKQFGKTMKVIADNLFTELSDQQKSVLMEQCCIEEQKALHNNKKNITFPDVVDTIKEIHEKIPVYIVSNCQKGYIEVVIEKNQLDSYIKDFECYGNNGFNKDENISLICKRNNIKFPVYVGDTDGDYCACKKANVPFIWASYGFGVPDDNDFYGKIEKFSDLPNLLKLN